jgi:hypothetical protein
MEAKTPPSTEADLHNDVQDQDAYEQVFGPFDQGEFWEFTAP